MAAPDPFAGVAGHAAVRRLLAGQLAAGRLAHAYLFVGEPALGKTTVARALAAALLPQAPLDRHPDYWEDDRGQALRIDEVRLLPEKPPEHHLQSLQAFLMMKPAIARHRVAVISTVGRLADPVQGILLKTLEEPQPGRVIVLTTPSVSPFVVLPTVVSRCQRVSFHALGASEVSALLRQQGAGRELAEALAELSRGRPGWALRAARDGSILERHRAWAERLEDVFRAPADAALRLAAELDAEGARWRQALRGGQPEPVAGDGPPPPAPDDPVLFALQSWQLVLRRRLLEAPAAGKVRWARLMERWYDTAGYLEQNVSARLALECFLLECRRAS